MACAAPTPSTVGLDRDEDLKALEIIMEEFFSVSTGNERKREIENMLDNFRRQKEAWRRCLHFMAATHSHYVCMFALNTLELVIRREWIGLPGSEHVEIRETLNRFLVDHFKSAPPFIGNKLIKLVVDIARTDWPHFYPNFMNHALELARTPDSMRLGLSILLIASEELATPRDDLATGRKEELKKLFTAQSGQILNVCCTLLESVMEKQKKAWNCGGRTSTPPPSPQHLQDGSDQHSHQLQSAFTTSPVQDGSLLRVASNRLLGARIAAGYGSARETVARLPPFDSESEEVSSLALRCLGHLFTWIPLSSSITPQLLDIIFQFAALGSIPDEENSHISSLNGNNCNSTLGVLAMSAINEIMYRNCVPTDFEGYLFQMFGNTFQLLQAVLSESPATPNKARLCLLDENYIDKLTEFLRSFVSSHLGRFDGHDRFPVLEFLSLMFKYTFLQPRAEAFTACLDAWSTIIDYVTNALANNRGCGKELSGSPRGGGSSGLRLLARYQEGFLALTVEVLARMQFRIDHPSRSMLQDLDNSTLDDDDETEWQKFLQVSIEVIMKVAELLPDDVLRIVAGPWKECSTVYFTLENHVSNGRLNVSPAELTHLHSVMRDFTTLLQLIGRISALFVGEEFLTRIDEGNELVKQLIMLASLGAKTKFYDLPGVQREMAQVFVDVQAHTLAALKAWCHWLAKLHTASLKNQAYEVQCRELTSKVTLAAVTVIKDECDEEVGKKTSDPHSQSHSTVLVHSAVHFLVTLTGTVRPPSIWKLKEFTDLYARTQRLRMAPEDHRLLVRSLTNVLLLHWPGLNEQRWEERQKHLAKFLRDISKEFRDIRTTQGFDHNQELQKIAQPAITHTLRIVRDLVENVLDEITQTKKLIYECVREYIDIALWLFPRYVASPVMCGELFDFFYTAFDVLKAQMGAAAVEAAIQTFMSFFDKELIAKAIADDAVGVRVVERFLGILEFVTKEPNSSFRKFIPSTLQLVLQHIYPLVAEKPSADVKSSIYSVLKSILLHNQRYFFKPSVVRSLGNPQKEEEVLNRTEFMAIMEAYGQSFLQPDITVFQQNLAALEEINKKWKLFQKAVFTEHLTAQFLTVLLQSLLARSHDLLREEIVCCLHSMASADFGAFFNHFLPHFIEQTGQVDQNQANILKNNFKSETDLPSFSSNVLRFVNDLRYYKLCNSSLPAGSVKFQP